MDSSLQSGVSDACESRSDHLQSPLASPVVVRLHQPHPPRRHNRPPRPLPRRLRDPHPLMHIRRLLVPAPVVAVDDGLGAVGLVLAGSGDLCRATARGERRCRGVCVSHGVRKRQGHATYYDDDATRARLTFLREMLITRCAAMRLSNFIMSASAVPPTRTAMTIRGRREPIRSVMAQGSAEVTGGDLGAEGRRGLGAGGVV